MTHLVSPQLVQQTIDITAWMDETAIFGVLEIQPRVMNMMDLHSTSHSLSLLVLAYKQIANSVHFLLALRGSTIMMVLWLAKTALL